MPNEIHLQVGDTIKVVAVNQYEMATNTARKLLVECVEYITSPSHTQGGRREKDLVGRIHLLLGTK